MSITIVLVTIVMLLLFSSCGDKKKVMAQAISDQDSLPVMATYKVVTLISDSGVTRYRLNTDEWMVYDKKNPPCWAFEKGIYLEQFDSLLKVDASIKADTAYFYNREERWKLMGHVAIKNRRGERFNTELLYWDQAAHRVYSDKFIRIVQPDRIITGHGFDSNEEMTVYVINNMEGVFYVEDKVDSVKTDSVKKI
ncbi:MAG: LPS export ABC transporter periplasmic protein LptC [Bacteroides sp.]